MSATGSLTAEELFLRYGPLVYRRALFLLRNPSDAEDATQEIFVRTFAHLDRFRRDAKPTTWLYRIATNYCLNILRDHNKRTQLLRDHHDHRESLPKRCDPATDLAMRQLLRKADPKLACTAVYIYLDGMTQPEAAEALGVSLRTVRNRLRKFVAWAKREIGHTGPEQPDWLRLPWHEDGAANTKPAPSHAAPLSGTGGDHLQ